MARSRQSDREVTAPEIAQPGEQRIQVRRGDRIASPRAIGRGPIVFDHFSVTAFSRSTAIGNVRERGAIVPGFYGTRLCNASPASAARRPA